MCASCLDKLMVKMYLLILQICLLGKTKMVCILKFCMLNIVISKKNFFYTYLPRYSYLNISLCFDKLKLCI